MRHKKHINISVMSLLALRHNTHGFHLHRYIAVDDVIISALLVGALLVHTQQYDLDYIIGNML